MEEQTKNLLTIIMTVLVIIILLILLAGLLTGHKYAREFCLMISKHLGFGLFGWEIRPLDMICNLLPL